MALQWMGAQLEEEVVAAIIDGVTEFGLTHETEAKRELTPGRGVLTGTLRRSIHAAAPNYNFGRDDTPPRPNSPERSGQGLEVSRRSHRVAVTIGSGMRYALRIEELYGYVQNSHRRVFPRFEGILEKHAARHGLTR